MSQKKNQIVFLVIIYRNEDNSVVRQKVTGDFQAGIYHVEPIGMKAAIAFSVALHWVNQLVAIIIKGSTGCLEIFARLCKIVIIDEVITGIIGWEGL